MPTADGIATRRAGPARAFLLATVATSALSSACLPETPDAPPDAPPERVDPTAWVAHATGQTLAFEGEERSTVGGRESDPRALQASLRAELDARTPDATRVVLDGLDERWVLTSDGRAITIEHAGARYVLFDPDATDGPIDVESTEPGSGAPAIRRSVQRDGACTDVRVDMAWAPDGALMLTERSDQWRWCEQLESWRSERVFPAGTRTVEWRRAGGEPSP